VAGGELTIPLSIVKVLACHTLAGMPYLRIWTNPTVASNIKCPISLILLGKKFISISISIVMVSVIFFHNVAPWGFLTSVDTR
jgi:hypothetical protein